MSEITIFDKILTREIPADVVYESEDVLAFRDINPQTPVHVLVIPKKKKSKFDDLVEVPAEEAGIFFKEAAVVARKLGLAEKGYRVILNCGKEGGQTVDYLHAHILGGRPLGEKML